MLQSLARTMRVHFDYHEHGSAAPLPETAHEHLVRNTTFAGLKQQARRCRKSCSMVTLVEYLLFFGFQQSEHSFRNLWRQPRPRACLKKRQRISCGLGSATRMRFPAAQLATGTVRQCTWIRACTSSTSWSPRFGGAWFQQVSCKLATHLAVTGLRAGGVQRDESDLLRTAVSHWAVDVRGCATHCTLSAMRPE